MARSTKIESRVRRIRALTGNTSPKTGRVASLLFGLVLAGCGGLVASTSVAPVTEDADGRTAYAIPLKGITIDGLLDDWPENMAAYPVAWVSPLYKPEPPEGPQDLTANFHVGHDEVAGLLYLAVVVRDEDVVVHPNLPAQKLRIYAKST